jgi:hypothetical protein
MGKDIKIKKVKRKPKKVAKENRKKFIILLTTPMGANWFYKYYQNGE